MITRMWRACVRFFTSSDPAFFDTPAEEALEDPDDLPPDELLYH